MNNKRFKQIISFFILFIIFFAIGINCNASLVSNISCAQKDGKGCNPNDLVWIFVNASKWILGITGSLALLAFVAGGVMFLISSGSTERVTRGKQMIIGAVIGLVIVLTSWLVIGFVMEDVLGYPKDTWYRIK